MKPFMMLLVVLCSLALAWGADVADNVTQGALRVKLPDGGVVECPLKHTDVRAEITGYLVNAVVTQTFVNPTAEKIEAVYVFPLPHSAAVTAMDMTVGDRHILGIIRRREEAKAIYQQAIQRGQTAALLEQERPNIFTQTVGNIKPGAEVRIQITYLDVLAYDDGVYEFHFPMVVAPRFMPGNATSGVAPLGKELQGKVGAVPAPATGAAPTGTGWSPDTDRVPDASRISPPVLKPGERTGHDISLSLKLDAGVPIQNLRVVNHQADVQRDGDAKATILLSPADAIPNKDFVFRYYVKGAKPTTALLTHSAGSGEGYFMLMFQPGTGAEAEKKELPREICFVIDVSGSMQGAPTDKVKQVMRAFLKRVAPADTVQVITFADGAAKLFPKAVPATPDNINTAVNFTDKLNGNGGTQMLSGLQLALNAPRDPTHMRMIVLCTDGDVGNETEVMALVKQSCGDSQRVSVVGIGSSPNRFLLDGIAKAGQGVCGVVELPTDPTELVDKLSDRLHHAQMADIAIDWKNLSVFDTYPRKIPDLWPTQPVTVFGRYYEGGADTIRIAGTFDGTPATRELAVNLPSAASPEHAALAPVWARRKIDDLSMQMLDGSDGTLVEEITRTALQYKLMSQYTSFVAVDESEVGPKPVAPPRRMVVAVPLPDGMSFAGVFGGEMPTSVVTSTGRDINGAMRMGTYGDKLALSADPSTVCYEISELTPEIVSLCAQNDAGQMDAFANTSIPKSGSGTPTYINEGTVNLSWTPALGTSGYEIVNGGTAAVPDPFAGVPNGKWASRAANQPTVTHKSAPVSGQPGKALAPAAKPATAPSTKTPPPKPPPPLPVITSGPTGPQGPAGGKANAGKSGTTTTPPPPAAEAAPNLLLRYAYDYDGEGGSWEASADKPFIWAIDARTASPIMCSDLGDGKDRITVSGEMEGRANPSYFRQQGLARHREARQAFDEAGKLYTAGRLDAALGRAQQAYLLEMAGQSMLPDDPSVRLTILNRVAAIQRRIVAYRTRTAPALAKTLTIEVRDLPLGEALAAVGRAAGVPLTIADGSLDDAARMLGVPVVKIDYLDLRGVSVAQALDELIATARLGWRVKDGAVSVGSVRRLAGDAAWLYPVGDLLNPTGAEYRATGQTMVLEKAARQFLTSVRAVIGQTVDGGYAPGSAVLASRTSLYVYGDAATHAKVAAFLAALQDPAAALPATPLTPAQTTAVNDLRKATAARWTARAAAQQAQRDAVARQRILAACQHGAWPLLAAAVRKEADPARVFSLNAALADPQAVALAATPEGLPVLRAAWAAQTAQRLLPDNADLAALAKSATPLTAARRAAPMQADNEAALAAYLYAALAQPAATATAFTLPATPTVTQVLAAALLTPSAEHDAALTKLLTAHSLAVNDHLLLATLAAQRRPAVQKVFHEELPVLTKNPGLSREVVVLANRERW